MPDTPFLSATEHALAIRNRHATSTQLTDLYIGRIQQHNPALHAVVVGNEQAARQTARERDDDLKRDVVRGPLHGVPVTVKESFNLAGLKTTVNVPRLKNNVASTDALIVKRLKAAGACILGKTNIPTMLSDWQSFGPLYPTANNRFDETRTPGGSTGGGAAAVAAGLTPLEIGSDIGGSIRVPSHFCGVFGLKPTENAMMHGDGHVPQSASTRSRGSTSTISSSAPSQRGQLFPTTASTARSIWTGGGWHTSITRDRLSLSTMRAGIPCSSFRRAEAHPACRSGFRWLRRTTRNRS